MKLIANVIGATGLVGEQLVNILLEDNNFEKIRIFVFLLKVPREWRSYSKLKQGIFTKLTEESI